MDCLFSGVGLRNKRRKDRFGKRNKRYNDEYLPKHDGIFMDEIIYGNWTRLECFKIERGLLTFGYVFLILDFDFTK